MACHKEVRKLNHKCIIDKLSFLSEISYSGHRLHILSNSTYVIESAHKKYIIFSTTNKKKLLTMSLKNYLNYLCLLTIDFVIQVTMTKELIVGTSKTLYFPMLNIFARFEHTY